MFQNSRKFLSSLIVVMGFEHLYAFSDSQCNLENRYNYQQKKYEEKLKLLLKQDPNRVDCLLSLASLYLKSDRVSSGFKLISKAYSIDKNAIQKSSLSKVLDLALRVTKLDELAHKDRDFTLFNELGDNYYEMGIFNDAAKAYKESLKLQPDQNSIKILLALSLGNLDQMKEAAKIIKEVIESDPYNFYANYYYGKILKNELGLIEDGNAYLLAARYIFKNRKPHFKNRAERDFIKKDLDHELEK